MQRQGSFSQVEYAGKKKQTRRDKFLAEMEVVVPWSRLVERLRPLYPKGERGRPPIGLERMLRVYFLQQWYGLADEALEDALYDSQALRGFAGIDLNLDDVIAALGDTVVVSLGNVPDTYTQALVGVRTHTPQPGVAQHVVSQLNKAFFDSGSATHLVTRDAHGDLIVADSHNHRIRRVSATGTLTTLAGTDSYGYPGDGGAPNAARVAGPRGVEVTPAGEVLIGDTGNHRIRRVH